MAALWIGLGYATNQLIRFGSSLVLTRLLAPEMYGLMTMGMVAMAAAPASRCLAPSCWR